MCGFTFFDVCNDCTTLHTHAVPLPPPGVSGVSAFLNLLATALPKLKTPFLTAAAATLVASLAALQTNTGDHRDAYQCVRNCLTPYTFAHLKRPVF